MCGIAGIINFSNSSRSNEAFNNFTPLLNHRGPDGCGTYVDINSKIAFAHTRLSIIDITTSGNQPFITDSGEYVIVFNGEIYNYKALRSELSHLGYRFNTNTDTEVLLYSYIEWSLQCLDKFNGIFAFAIFDKKKNIAVLSRDKFGIKPLYFSFVNNEIYFSSEIKVISNLNIIEKSINVNSLFEFFVSGFIVDNKTIFSNINRLRPNESLIYDFNTNNVTFESSNYLINSSDAFNISVLDELFSAELNEQTTADVPVGVFLSGGYDSSVVAAILQKNSAKKIKTFTIGFNEKNINEANYAKDIANFLQTEHYEHYCTKKDALEIFPKLANIYDEPFGDPSSIPTVLLSDFARKHVTVSLSADGGDEVFAGYSKYSTVAKYREIFKGNKTLKKISSFLLEKIKFKNFNIFQNIKNFNSKYDFINSLINNKNPIELMKILSYIFSDDEIKKLLKSENVDDIKTNYENNIIDFKKNDDLNALLAVDFKTYLSDNILVKVDRATMSSSLEGREPFLDHRIIEFCSLLPSNFKIKKNISKFLLKDIVHKYISKEFLNRPKMGFVPPLLQWLKNDFSEIIDSFFNASFLDKQKILDKEYILSMYRDFINGKKENLSKLWLVMIFFNWYKKWYL